MGEQDWFVTNEEPYPEAEVVPQDEDFLRPYRLYRFLTDLEDILERVKDDQVRLTLICPLVRRLLNRSEWLQMNFLPPDPTTGWLVLMLYHEPDFPITIQNVVWSPGSVSPIHNHATWGMVALLSGQEKNTFWRRCPLNPPILGDFRTCFLLKVPPCWGIQGVIRVAINQRFEFDLEHQTAQIF